MGQTSDRVISMTTRKTFTNTEANSLKDQASLILQAHQKWVLWLLQTSQFPLPPRQSSTLVQVRCPLHLPFFLLWKRGQQQFSKQSLYTRKGREAVKATHPTQDLSVTGKLGPRLPTLNPTPLSRFSLLSGQSSQPQQMSQSLPARLLGFLCTVHAGMLRLQWQCPSAWIREHILSFPFPTLSTYMVKFSSLETVLAKRNFSKLLW